MENLALPTSHISEIMMWVGIGLGVLVIIGSIIVGILDKDAMSGLLACVLLCIVGAFIGGIIYAILSAVLPKTSNEDNVKNLQTWAQETYLINIPDKQADFLLNHIVNLNDAPNDDYINSVFVMNEYNKIVEVTLIKESSQDDKDNLVLFIHENEAVPAK
jgi:uncharacterized membrane protein YeaQ/YmgE (transglycosylase-associated protein family)